MPSAYCSADDLSALGVNSRATAQLDAEAFAAAIQAASAEIDSYLRGRFVLPLTTVGADVKAAAATLAAWRVLTVRGLRPGENPEDNALYLEVKSVRAWLKQIADGQVTPDVLDSSSGGTEGIGSAAPALVSNQQRGWFSPSPWPVVPFQGRRQS